MTVADVLRAVRARWLLFFLCCAVPVVAGVAVIKGSSPSYESTAELYVATTGGSTAANAYQGALLAQQQAPSLAHLVDSPAVLNAVISRLGLATNSASLAKDISASSPTNSVLIDVTARGSSPAAARDIANAAAGRLASLAEHLAGSGPQSHSTVRVTLANPASLPIAPVSQHKTTDLILGLVVGLAVAFSAVILREKLDPRVRTIQQAQAIARSRFASAVRVGRQRAVPWRWIQMRVDSSVAESFRRLRVRLVPAATSSTHCLAVTSLVRRDPGPAIAANLALALADSGSTVLLLDTDPRSSRIADYFDADRSVGISNVINGITPLETAVQTYHERLLILLAGAARAVSGPATSRSELRELVELLGRQVDHVVVSVPPLLVHADAAELCATADTVVLAARRGSAKRPDLEMATEILRSAGANPDCVLLAPARLTATTSSFLPHRRVRAATLGKRTEPPVRDSGQSALSQVPSPAVRAVRARDW
jgi:capsular polysaccharide biosynthesis protein